MLIFSKQLSNFSILMKTTGKIIAKSPFIVFYDQNLIWISGFLSNLSFLINLKSLLKIEIIYQNLHLQSHQILFFDYRFFFKLEFYGFF